MAEQCQHRPSSGQETNLHQPSPIAVPSATTQTHPSITSQYTRRNFTSIATSQPLRLDIDVLPFSEFLQPLMSVRAIIDRYAKPVSQLYTTIHGITAAITTVLTTPANLLSLPTHLLRVLKTERVRLSLFWAELTGKKPLGTIEAPAVSRAHTGFSTRAESKGLVLTSEEMQKVMERRARRAARL